MNEPTLRSAILGAIAATVPVVVTASACGSHNTCQTMCCDLPPGQQYTVTYTACPPPVLDAGGDAEDAADASDATDAAVSVCYSDCYSACQAQKPSNAQTGSASCVGTPDAGADGGVVAQCEILQLCGRRLEGLEVPRNGDDIAHAAWLEAASIHAFRRLARELEAHGAPDHLIRRARVCARDEARHARIMSRMARRRGARVPAVVVRPTAARDLESVARENAVEACVGETFGALYAEWHAQHAPDPELREAMREIAPDELRHAALGWAVAAWAESKLDAQARARVRSARNEALTRLLAMTCQDPRTRTLRTAMAASGLWAR